MSDSESPDDETTEFNLRLYVAGQTPKSLAAIANLQKICEENLAGRYKIEVIDLVVQPQLAAGDQIVAIPTLVRRLPPPLTLDSWLTFPLPTAYSWGFRGGRERECSLRFLFEDYALDTDRRELQRAREEVVVTPQVFDLIEYLIRNRDASSAKTTSSAPFGRVASSRMPR